MKKFLSYFNIFELNLYSRSYKSGLIRIGVSALTLFLALAIRFSITLTNPLVNLVVSLLVFAIVILSVLCFFVASVECLQVGDNIKKYNERNKK